MTHGVFLAEPASTDRFVILDLLRFLAAFWVMLYHYSFYMDEGYPSAFIGAVSFGYLGVNFFFMLSGFVIMMSAMGRSAYEFAAARFLRVYPAFWICLIVTITVVSIVSGHRYSVLETLANATILNDYLGISNIDGVYWTLQAEIKFYGLVFLLLLFGLIRFVRSWLTIWIALAICHHCWAQPFFLGWIVSPSYSFYFIGGISSYLIYQNNKSKFGWVCLVISMLFCIVKSEYQIDEFLPNHTDIDSFLAKLQIFFFFIFFAMISIGKRLFNVPVWTVTLGAISYPLYLVHNLAGKTLITYMGSFVEVDMAIAIAILVSCLISTLVAIYLEPVARTKLKRILLRLEMLISSKRKATLLK